MQLNKIIFQCGTTVTTPTIDLADHHTAGGGAGRAGEGQRQCQAQRVAPARRTSAMPKPPEKKEKRKILDALEGLPKGLEPNKA